MPRTLPLSKMTRSEKLIAMESLWQDLSRDDAQFTSPAWHAEALKDAERLVKSGKATFSDWDEAKLRIKRAAARLT
jgi:hypothetical protein